MTLTDCMCLEKKKEEDLPALKIALTPRYNDSETRQKSCEGRLITAIKNNIDNTRIYRTNVTRKQKWKKNSCMDISSTQVNLDVAKKMKP